MKNVFCAVLIFSLALFLNSFLSSCRSGEITERDKLNPVEQKFLVDNAREIFLKSKRFKLTPLEMEYIKNNEPEKGFAYKGYKEGKASFSWQVSENKRIILIIEGELLKEDRSWRVIVSRNEDIIYRDETTKKIIKAPQIPQKFDKDTKTAPSIGKSSSL